MKKLRITFNSPVTLGFVFISFVAMLLGVITRGKATDLLFMTWHSPLTFILVFAIYIGQQVFEGIFLKDNVSNLSHIIGGLIGAVVGYRFNRKTGQKES